MRFQISGAATTGDSSADAPGDGKSPVSDDAVPGNTASSRNKVNRSSAAVEPSSCAN